MDEVLIGLVEIVVTIVAYAVSMAYWLGSKFKEIVDSGKWKISLNIGLRRLIRGLIILLGWYLHVY